MRVRATFRPLRAFRSLGASSARGAFRAVVTVLPYRPVTTDKTITAVTARQQSRKFR
jgi:hypothetical protein